jgi:hypothetical protein
MKWTPFGHEFQMVADRLFSPSFKTDLLDRFAVGLTELASSGESLEVHFLYYLVETLPNRNAACPSQSESGKSWYFH